MFIVWLYSQLASYSFTTQALYNCMHVNIQINFFFNIGNHSYFLLSSDDTCRMSSVCGRFWIINLLEYIITIEVLKGLIYSNQTMRCSTKAVSWIVHCQLVKFGYTPPSPVHYCLVCMISSDCFIRNFSGTLLQLLSSGTLKDN